MTGSGGSGSRAGGGGGGVLGDPYHMGGGGGSNTEHGTIYAYIYIYMHRLQPGVNSHTTVGGGEPRRAKPVCQGCRHFSYEFPCTRP